MNSVFKKDLYRYYGENGEPFLKKVFRPLELKYIKVFRKANRCRFAPLKSYYMFRLMCLSQKTQIQIPARTAIGEGLYIGHLGRVIIHPDAKLGKNINIATGVTIGMENRGKRKGAPVIGDNCWIGGSVTICGGVTIGEGCVIGAGSVVTRDIPPNSLAAGNPCRVIRQITEADLWANHPEYFA